MVQTPIHHSLSVTHYVVPFSPSRSLCHFLYLLMSVYFSFYLSLQVSFSIGCLLLLVYKLCLCLYLYSVVHSFLSILFIFLSLSICWRQAQQPPTGCLYVIFINEDSKRPLREKQPDIWPRIVFGFYYMGIFHRENNFYSVQTLNCIS